MSLSTRTLENLIHQSNLIEGFDDPEFDAQSIVAWDYLSGLGLEHLTHRDIKKVQKIITLPQTNLQPDWRGYYRNIDVSIGGRLGIEPSRIEEAMTNWIAQLSDVDPIAHHVIFEKIHPFVDGNGRTGRMLMWWQQLIRGEKPTLVLYKDRNKYYKWFE